ncbi:hypothetical protein CDD81_4874 [Ophiocordyceps australis]|uniref:NADPH:adrenodoxin oxidoreductase, mitochondrial n=1 Tax=Ophiocordyceps australis TaxID=1399860 RepID=A0A2C5XUQ8_9HYPO|nr:hypothetical protein CDD81_4874 [Ophiocordyceps australis]
MYEALPVPFGLVRHGVAPDHPEVKNCEKRFDEVASSPNFCFVGNVSVDHPAHLIKHCVVKLDSLLRNYDSVLLAYGASQDRKLNIEGESSLSGVYSARQFVGWYNGLPDCAHLDPDLTGEEAIIIGQGNVALDVARMLLEHVDVLRRTDIAENALARLAQSRVRRVHVIGRRGPMQAAFTIKELRELMKLPGVAFHAVNPSLIPQLDQSGIARPLKRLMGVLLQGSPESLSHAPKSWSLESCLSPRRFLGRENGSATISRTQFDKMKLADPFDPQSPVSATGECQTLQSDLVFRSVGYQSVPLPGFAGAGIGFDAKRGIVYNDGLGRVFDDGIRRQHVAGVYCAGWVKRGPTGVIASTMQDAFTTADAIIQDWLHGASFLQTNQDTAARGWNAVKQEAGPMADFAVSWQQWRKIDSAERERGELVGKARVKFTSIADMLSVVF